MQILIILALVYFVYVAFHGKTGDEQRAAGSKLAEWISRLFLR